MVESNKKKATINAKGMDIAMFSSGQEHDFISLTDIARYNSDEPTAVIQELDDFKPIEFEGFKNESGRNAFSLPSKTDQQHKCHK